MSDQELDDLFKDASAKYEAPFDDKEWEKMADLLDESSSPKPAFWNWKTWSGLGLLLLIGSTLVVTQWDRISGEQSKSNKSTTTTLVLSVDSLSNASKEDGVTVTEGNEVKKSQLKNDNQERVQSKSLNSDLSQSESNSKGGAKKSDMKSSSMKSDVITKNKESKENSINSESGKESNSITAKNTIVDKKQTEKSKANSIHSKITTDKKVSESRTEETNTTVSDKSQQSEIAIVSNSVANKSLVQDKIPMEKEENELNSTRSRITNKKGNENETGEVNTSDLSKGQQSEKIILNPVTNNPVVVDETLTKKEKENKDGKEKNALASDFVSKQNVSSQLQNGKLLPTNEDRRMPEVVKPENKNSKEAINNVKENSQSEKDNSTELPSDISDHDSKMISTHANSDSVKSKTVAVEKKDSVIVKDVAKKEENKKTDSLTKLQRFSVKLALSPDFSSVGYYKPGKTGFNYGLLGEYNITSHWSVTLGAIWSKKIYSDNTTEDLGYGTVNSKQIKGSCRVLDLPLNVTYYFTPQNRFSFYSSLGLSSYFMFDEDYTYDYVYGTKSYSYTKKIDRGNTEWFRMMNLSVGIQQQLSPRVRLQLEPFIKAPLSGIGGGDLKLVSSGVFFNVKYTFK